MTSTMASDRDPVGHGRMLRKEDPRFLQGKGRFVDDMQVPDMLHLAILRAPLAHARIVNIDISAAQAHPSVQLVVTGTMLAGRGLAWMPTLTDDVQAVLATDKVRFQGQEVAFVVARDRYAARDALELIDVEYDPLPAVVSIRTALDPDAPVVRDDLPGRVDNRCFDWEAGDAAAADAVFARAEVVVAQEMVYPRVHPAPLETCAAVADYDPTEQTLTVWVTSQAPHAHRTLYAQLIGVPEHKVRVISPDIGGGFGNKVPIYPGYVCAIVASQLVGRPVKWSEDRYENLVSTAFARDYVMHGEIAATRQGRILGVRATVLADHGAFNAVAVPTKFPAGFFGVFTGSYDIEVAHCRVSAVYTNKAPGGVAYACSFRITEAVYLIERLVDCLAAELSLDPVVLRQRNLLRPEQFPHGTPTGWVYDSGDYPATLAEALRIAGYEELRREQARRREHGELMGIGVSFFTEAVGAGPRRHMDIKGLAMADGSELVVHPTGTAELRVSCQSQGQGHETTFAQIVAEQLGIAPAQVQVVHGDTDRTPYGLGTYGSRSTAVSGAAAALVSRQVREQARVLAAAMLEVSPTDLSWVKGSFHVTGDSAAVVTIGQIAAFAYGPGLPEGMEGGLRAQLTYDPPQLTNPYGAYICVVDVDPQTAVVTVRRFIAVDDCGVRINPMIVEGQIHGGLTDGIGMALMQMIAFDELGNCLGGSFMDYLLPTALEVPDWETGYTITPSPHHPLGAKGVGESATVGSPAAVVNAVVDALRPIGVRHLDMPMTPSRVWEAMTGQGQPPF
ncbi:MAG TPA: aerobic carbon-monoxide dehydrogenase large subunit [Micromonosporaceae bacterium]